MSWLVIVILAQIFIGTAAVFDRILLKKSVPNPAVFTFWLGILSLAVFVLAPFGLKSVPLRVFALALIAGISFLVASWTYYRALFIADISEGATIIGGLAPIFTLLFGLLWLPSAGGFSTVAFTVLVSGSLVIFFTGAKRIRAQLMLMGLASGLFFGLSNVLSKLVFLDTNFVSGLVWIRSGSVLGAVFMLLLPNLKNQIFSVSLQTLPKGRLTYILNRVYSSVGTILVYYAFSLANPALVDATQSLRYVVIFLTALVVSLVFPTILKEKFVGLELVGKIAAVILVGVGLVWLAFSQYFVSNPVSLNRPISWGITFSQPFAEEIGLDSRKTFSAILNDLRPKEIRLIAYLQDVEPRPGEFDFNDLDWQMTEAQKNSAEVILALGRKTPRWPECRWPDWVASLTEKEFGEAILNYVQEVVARYKSYGNLKYWQVENEPFLMFGECGTTSGALFDREVALVKKMDPAHQIITTDGGELGLWYPAAKRGDVFGATMYRQVHSGLLGYFTYPLPPEYFRTKELIVREILGDKTKHFLVIELQGEPWLTESLGTAPLDEQFSRFDLNDFQNTVEYAKRAGFGEYYLWGVEWWYWLGEKHNNWEFWEFVKALFGEQTPVVSAPVLDSSYYY